MVFKKSFQKNSDPHRGQTIFFLTFVWVALYWHNPRESRVYSSSARDTRVHTMECESVLKAGRLSYFADSTSSAL